MSRCFPFPPPGYLRNGACSVDFIKSIKFCPGAVKLQERDEAKEQRKKDKRERKDKRKERKERKKEAKAALHYDGKEKECKLTNLKPYELEKIRTDQGSGCLLKVADDENEQIERSGITEEHDQPFSSIEPCCLSDSTQTSNKRKRSMSPSSSDHGTAIKIRLPLRKHRDHEELQQDNRPGSTGSKGITKSAEESRPQSQGRRNSESEHKEYQHLIRAGVDPSTDSIDSERGRMASLYNSLFQNWNSFALQSNRFELEDRDWLSKSERQELTQATKKVKYVSDSPGCSSSILWPRAQYLPEADIYGLPYTVPF